MTGPPSAAVDLVVWITSLHEGEKGTSERVLEDLEPFFAANRCRFEIYNAGSAAGLVGVLHSLAERARKGERPMIKIDTHGSKTDGLLIAETGEKIPWPILAAKLRAINVATQNNLIVISGACF